MDNLNKYQYTGKTKVFRNHVLHQIVATRNFDSILTTIHEGDLGGWIESKMNLSNDGNCWVMDNAIVMNNSNVTGNAVVKGNSIVRGKVKVYGESIVDENAEVYGTVKVYDNAVIDGKVKVHGCIEVCEYMWITSRDYYLRNYGFASCSIARKTEHIQCVEILETHDKYCYDTHNRIVIELINNNYRISKSRKFY